jgi:hypothetical protein
MEHLTWARNMPASRSRCWSAVTQMASSATPAESPQPTGSVWCGGAVSLFATYWADAWHTDLGRDSALIPPHVMLYGSVTVAGLIVVTWGLRVLVRSRSMIAVLRYRPLLLAGLGGVFTLAAAPVGSL